MSASPTILDTLADEARQRVEASLPTVNETEMMRRAYDTPVRPGFLFESGLAGDGLSFICEVKRASPSRGLIAPHFPYLGIARDYAQGGAAGISVLTEPRHFLGSDQYLTEIAGAVEVPVLRKDFTVSAYQIYQARALGASAVLLICAILSDSQLLEFLGLADELGLSCLTEAHDSDEVERAVRAGARVVGVNNRNLHDFTIDRATSGNLRTLVPHDRLFVAESGIRSVEDAVAAARLGADAVLIGESLMTAPDRRGFLRQMIDATRSGSGPVGTVPDAPSGPVGTVPDGSPTSDSDHRHAARSRSIHDDRGESGFCDFAQNDSDRRDDTGRPDDTGRRDGTGLPDGTGQWASVDSLYIKICGVWRDDDLAVLNEVLPQYVGFVFHAGSRRCVDLATAQRLRGVLDQRICCVGVFKDAPLDEVVAVARSGAVRLVQLHGTVSAGDIDRVRAGAPGVGIIRAVSVTGVQSIVDAAEIGADYLLLDGPNPGSGEGFDWGLIGQARQLVPLPPLFLAGGLTPDNVSSVAGLGVAVVDVSSGVESDGAKDPALIRAFTVAVRGIPRGIPRHDPAQQTPPPPPPRTEGQR